MLEAINLTNFQQAQAYALTAKINLYSFLTDLIEIRSGELVAADSNSAYAVSFLLQQQKPFFLPALILAGTIRITEFHYQMNSR